MTNKYRVWNHGSPQGHYTTANSPKQAIIKFIKLGSGRTFFKEKLRYPIHVLLWSIPDELHPLGKMTKKAEKFQYDNFFGREKYTKDGEKYFKEDLV